jgi:hypothetical protein
MIIFLDNSVLFITVSINYIYYIYIYINCVFTRKNDVLLTRLFRFPRASVFGIVGGWSQLSPLGTVVTNYNRSSWRVGLISN